MQSLHRIASDRILMRPREHSAFARQVRSLYVDCATLMKHSMGIDVLSCSKCALRCKPTALVGTAWMLRCRVN